MVRVPLDNVLIRGNIIREYLYVLLFLKQKNNTLDFCYFLEVIKYSNTYLLCY